MFQLEEGSEFDVENESELDREFRSPVGEYMWTQIL